MANKQQKQYGKLGFKTQNSGASHTSSVLVHGSDAFLKPCEAITRLRNQGSKSWKITKRHPNHKSNSK